LSVLVLTLEEVSACDDVSAEEVVVCDDESSEDVVVCDDESSEDVVVCELFALPDEEVFKVFEGFTLTVEDVFDVTFFGDVSFSMAERS